LKSNPNAASLSIPDLLKVMRSLAVVPIAIGVLRAELLQCQQQRDEGFRSFAARVRGKAETCAFAVKCSCGKEVDYTDNVIRDVLLSGITDSEIRRDVLGSTNILQKPVNDVIALVENKEMARNATPPSTLSAVSSFKRQKNAPSQDSFATQPTDRSKRASCPECTCSYNLYSEGVRGWNKKPHKCCIDCYRLRRYQKRTSDTLHSKSPTSQAVEVDNVISFQSSNHGTNNTIRLDHHIFTAGEWKRAHLRAHPTVRIKISIDKPARTRSARSTVNATVDAIADTGAQSDLWSLSEFLAHGFSKDELSPVTLGLSAANRSPIPIEGAFFARIETASSDDKSTRAMVYVSSAVKTMYLSYDTLLNLGLLPKCFPDTATTTTHGQPNDVTRSINNGCHAVLTDTCTCPIRTATPTRPPALPFACSPANNKKMKAWLLERYAASTFNTCPHRALPCMDGPPVEIHIDPEAKPKACHTPADIPLHWQQRVYEDLLRDEALNVIERVPYGEPVTWCHRMVVTRKHDGSPRRTVDLSPLNKYCKRETFASESPFHLARRIPQNTWKTVTDAWNGYHSVPLRESDRHLTTFITPFGRWRYTRAPQGFLSSGDGYNRRFDAVLSNFERKERCIDDTIHHDTHLETHWWRTIDFLTQVGQAGIVLNPDKFQFAERTVDFAGFRVSDTTIEPLPKYLDAIRDFPTPTSTTDIRSWFGLVNQVSNYAQIRDHMAPFKPFLSPRCKFSWSTELDEAFASSKKTIIDAIRRGVEIFDITKPTCLRPDWSNRGIGYFLLQRNCDCSSKTPGCCSDGWGITLAGSRFLSPTEQRYAAIEGEALAVAWGLEQTRYFTQGCNSLIVVTDHKPLVKIFGDRTLDEITNSRLFRLKQRTLPWHFEIYHLPGKSNLAADAMSRHPSPNTSQECSVTINDLPDIIESAFMSAIKQDVEKLQVIPYSLIASETAADPSMSKLCKLIETGFVNYAHDDTTISKFWPIRDALYIQDGVILYEDRVVIPPSLRQRVLKHLHAAHQGVSSMEQRARMVVYWPGLTKDIHSTRHSCDNCNRNAPSQPATLPIPNSPPSTPFEAIFADFFDYGGHHYLVIGDRLSGWVEVLGSNATTSSAGASSLTRHLRTFFSTFGVPTELSSDGGPEFAAGSTQEFLQRWGVNHRVSSAYFPQSNGRAEVAVKTAKRLLMSNIGPTGSLDHDKFLHAMLQLRNTPDPDCNISPAEVVFGKPLNDAFSFINRLEKYTNRNIRPLWRHAWAAKEEALRTRVAQSMESLKEHARPLRPLATGERVFLQNQHGNNPNKWDRSGTVMESLGNDQYWVKVDGSGRLTRRNRRFLRAYTAIDPNINQRTQTSWTAPPLATHRDSNPDPETSTHYTAPAPPTQPPTIIESSPDKTNQAPATALEQNPPEDTGDIKPPSDRTYLPAPQETPPITINDPINSVVPEDIPGPRQITTTNNRPQRSTRRPKAYEPESGRWV
jgi:hypothetical protein